MNTAAASASAARALDILGAAWIFMCPCGLALVDRIDACLERRGDRWYPAHADAARVFPQGFSMSQALGMTIAIGWEQAERGAALASIGSAPAPSLEPSSAGMAVSRYGVHWLVRLPFVTAQATLSAEAALPIVEALLVVRRVIVPRRPFAPRDQVAELLQRHARAMAALLRPPTWVQTIYPPIIASDVDRDWSGLYG